MIELAYRLLKPGGILVFKTTDFKLDNQRQWIADKAIETAKTLGFSLIDKLIYIKPGTLAKFSSPVGAAITRSRWNHFYFLVFRKK